MKKPVLAVLFPIRCKNQTNYGPLCVNAHRGLFVFAKSFEFFGVRPFTPTFFLFRMCYNEKKRKRKEKDVEKELYL